mgnify:FL=1|nr:MAG TPA: hypothetical protein [Caudoviricetes sp.]
MNNENMNKGGQAAANGENQVSKEEQIKMERMVPIFEDYEVKENGKVVHKWTLSLNGNYIPDITDTQMNMMLLELIKLKGADVDGVLNKAAAILDSIEQKRKKG